MSVTKKTIRRRVPADVILAIRQAEGWPRVEGDSLRTIRKAKELYDISTTRDGWYVATRRSR